MDLQTLQTHTLERLGETGTSGYYTGAEAIGALNAAQRIFVLLTLALEKTTVFPLAPNTVFYHLLDSLPDFLLPLRIRVTGGARVKPGRLQDFDALNPTWQLAAGNPERYACLGFDFLVLYKTPPDSTVSLDLTHAYSPALMTSLSVTPQIPEEYHAALIDFAVPYLRMKEGASEFTKSLFMMDRFLTAAQKMANFVRARNLAQRYDRMPFALDRFDRSKLLKLAIKQQKPAMLAIPQAEGKLVPTNG